MRNTFINTLTSLINENDDVVLITGDLGFSVFENFKEQYPGKYINAGVSEQSMIGLAAGMAMEGKKVYVYSIIPFLLYRPFEMIRNDICYQELPVTLVGVGSGFAYGCEGGTHHSIEDVGIMKILPGMNVFAPGCPKEVEKIVEHTFTLKSPAYIRLNRNRDPIVHNDETISAFRPNEPLLVDKYKASSDPVILFAMGNMLPEAVAVANTLKSKEISYALYSVHTLAPLNKNVFADIIKDRKLIVTLEEHRLASSLYLDICDICRRYECRADILPVGVEGDYIHIGGNQQFLRQKYGLDQQSIVSRIVNHI